MGSPWKVTDMCRDVLNEPSSWGDLVLGVARKQPYLVTQCNAQTHGAGSPTWCPALGYHVDKDEAHML